MRIIYIYFMVTKTMEKISAMNTLPQFQLLDLPNELIAQVIEAVRSRDDVRNLACTCRRIQHLAEPVLYRSVLFRSGPRATSRAAPRSASPARTHPPPAVHAPFAVRPAASGKTAA